MFFAVFDVGNPSIEQAISYIFVVITPLALYQVAIMRLSVSSWDPSITHSTHSDLDWGVIRYGLMLILVRRLASAAAACTLF